MNRLFHHSVAAALVLVTTSAAAVAGDCTGYVVGVRPISQYNHAKGNGFLAVRHQGHLVAGTLQDLLGDALVDRVVLGDQDRE